jgi:hypothetical protein
MCCVSVCGGEICSVVELRGGGWWICGQGIAGREANQEYLDKQLVVNLPSHLGRQCE